MARQERVRWTKPLAFESKTSRWLGEVLVGKRPIAVSKTELANPRPANRASAPLDVVASIEARAARALADVAERVVELAPAFVEQRRKYFGGATVSASQLAKRFVLQRVHLDESGYRLEFADPGLFDKHRPQITVEGGAVVDARLERPKAKNGRLVGPFDMAKLLLPIGWHAPKQPAKPPPLPKRRSQTPRWSASGALRLGKREVTVRTDANGAAFEARLGKLLGSLDDIRGRAVRSLATLYNESWREGRRLSAKQVSAKITLELIRSTGGAWSLQFSDGDLFGGHMIEVFVDGDDVRTDLIG